MRTYDHTLSIETITEILRGLAKSPDINNPGSRDYIRALQLLGEKKERDKIRNKGHFRTKAKIKT